MDTPPPTHTHTLPTSTLYSDVLNDWAGIFGGSVCRLGLAVKVLLRLQSIYIDISRRRRFDSPKARLFHRLSLKGFLASEDIKQNGMNNFPQSSGAE